MMLTGYFKNPDLLKLYLIRKHKEAEKNHNYSLIEFYDNCNAVLESLKQKFLNLYNERKNELYLIQSKQKTEKRDTSAIERDIETLNISDFGIPLLPITNHQFTGHLHYSDIVFIENTIKLIFVCIDENKDYSAQCNDGNFFYSGYENELYTGRQYFEKIYLTKGNLKFPINFPDLIPTYYNLALAEYLENEKNIASSFFDEKLVTLEFLKSELDKIKTLQEGIEDFINKNKYQSFNRKREQIKYCKRYSAFLGEKYKELEKIEVVKPQQIDTNKIENHSKELHTDIFNNNGFEIWQKMFDSFEIKESSYNKNLDFMYEAMLKEGYIHKHIGKQNMLDWITDTYQMTFSKIKYTNYKDSTNKNRLIIFKTITTN